MQKIVLLWQREKKDESHASGYKTVLSGQGDATSRPFLTITAHREVAHLGAKQSLQHEEDASRQAVLNHHCPMGRREETIFKQSSLLQPAKGNMPVQKGITSGKLAHSVHDQRSVEYVGPILSSLSRLHGGFMQRTGHREVGAEQAQSWGRMWPTEKKTKGEIKHTRKVSICLTVIGSRLMTPAAYSSETKFRTWGERKS
ncbi:hypothetical protein C8F04DRAFT_1292518 [Mycena alexandri]|uniref:Uncharacterized protein n=1 Tax=Mycena alexandri TaxID=1745969 RepID=A0AAD6SHX2_9AGAR|nr:hypothetical protein C8F04DRAFT_1292518 [Mycena alexandri]